MNAPSDHAVQRALEDEQDQEEQGGHAEFAPEDRERQRQAQFNPGGQDIVDDEDVRPGEAFAYQGRRQPEGEVVDEVPAVRFRQRPVAPDECFVNGVADHEVRVLEGHPRYSSRQQPQEGKKKGAEVNGQLPPGEVKRGDRELHAQQDGSRRHGHGRRNGEQGPDPAQQEEDGGQNHIGHGAGSQEPAADGERCVRVFPCLFHEVAE